MRAYALLDIGDRLAVDVFIEREDAFAARDDALHDQPEWATALYVAPIELDGQDVSPN
jgi:hypothetical protein